MSDKAFRFGVVATPESAAQWREQARRIEGQGYSTLLMPDGLRLLSPTAALPVAAEATTGLRVGTFVTAAALRPPRMAAWEAHSLTVLTEGRFEFGIGTGRADLAEAAVELLERPATTAAQRLDDVTRTVADLRELDGELRTPVMMAAGGPKARAVAATLADTVALAFPPLTDRAAVAETVTELRAAAGDRADDLELSCNIFLIGDDLPPWIAAFVRTDAATLAARDSLVRLPADVDAMVDELQRRRTELGVSYVTVNAAFADAFAPVVARLAGR
ncbi:LLM class flavin-dependent oxidoreductase [Nocardia stercoris]|uniref:LLM class flavin-dependent oxidoreductase n=1 Tax=Nocardia stercoris TaxID=2483361 RepID=A0A3M2KY25_9NOCA|nr:LLM class flavin-dependent oxidoreductase [Nocardia stercoris]RMI29143.1 LLM class flavin-dependent oxidoreductase [Nocardia stercoris]